MRVEQLVFDGNKLRERREECGLSKAQMVKKANESFSIWSYNGWEKGRRNPKQVNVVLMAKLLDCPVSSFFKKVIVEVEEQEKQKEFDGAKLKKMRMEKGYSQEKFALKAGVTASSVRKWEKEVREPSTQNVEVIAGILGINEEELYKKDAE